MSQLFTHHILTSWWFWVGFAPIHQYPSVDGKPKSTLPSAEWRGEIITQNLMGLIQLVHLVVLRQSFSTTKLDCRFMFNLSTCIPGHFLQRTKQVMKSCLGFIELNKHLSSATCPVFHLTKFLSKQQIFNLILWIVWGKI